jgi:hypothetical protein
MEPTFSPRMTLVYHSPPAWSIAERSISRRIRAALAATRGIRSADGINANDTDGTIPYYCIRLLEQQWLQSSSYVEDRFHMQAHDLIPSIHWKIVIPRSLRDSRIIQQQSILVYVS